MNELTTTQQLIEMSKMQTVTLEKVDNLEKGLLQAQNDIQEIMDTSYLHPGIINMITKKRRKRVIDCMGGKSAKAYKTFKVDEEGRKHRFQVKYSEKWNLISKQNLISIATLNCLNLRKKRRLNISLCGNRARILNEKLIC